MAQPLRYEEFEITDFLQDEFFVKWVSTHSPEASAFWEEWLRLHPQRAEVVAKAKTLVLAFGYRNNPVLSEQERIAMLEGIYRGKAVTKPQGNGQNKQIFWNGVRHYAAAIVLLLGAVTFYGLIRYFEEVPVEQLASQVQWKTTQALRGQKYTVKLPDGSTVRLNAASVLHYPETFGEDKRLIRIYGEAFLEVVKDSSRPFIIESGEILTKVLGTSFNIVADSAMKQVEVAVVSGKVSLAGRQQPPVVAGPDETLRYNPEQGTISKIPTPDSKAASAWKDSILYFNRATYNEVFRKLENWYDIEINTAPQLKLSGRYSGEYQHKSLEKVLEGIAYSSGFSYRIQGKQVLIYPKKT